MTVNITTVALTGDEWNPPYPPIVQIFGWLISCALSLETILGNAMVLLAYRLEKNISKQLNNRFIVSLAISDMIIGVEGIPFFTAFVINGDRWPLGPIACETWLFLDYTLCLVSILTVLLITADRYLSVCHTAYYLKWQTPFKVQMLIFGSWLLPAIIFGLMIYGWPWIGEREEEIRATSNGECYAPFLSNPFVNMSMYLAYYWTTLVAMLILYKGIHKAAKKLEKRSRAREHRHIALLLTQRLGTQVGVGLMLHARKYHEEVMKEKQPPAEVKDSGYTTNNTLSTSEPSDRRRSSFAILAKAVQSTQKLAQFRGRGTTFAFRTNSADENDAPKNRQLAVSIAHVQTKQQQQLERLTEQNSSSQVGAENAGEVREAEKAPVMPRANSVEEPAGNEGEELPSLSLAAPPNSSVKDVDEGNSSWADDEEGGEVDDIDEDEFPTDMVRRRFASGAVPSLSTEFFHDESLSSVLRFNPSALASPLLDQSDTSFDFLANRMGKFGTNNHNQAAVENGVKRHCFSLTSYPRKEFVKLVPMTSGSLKERRMNSSAAQETAALLPQFTESIRNVESTPESAPRKSEEEEEEECVGGDNERDLLCPIIPPPTVKEIASSKEEEIPIVLDVPPHPPQPLIPRFPTTRCLTPAGENAGEVQQRCSSASSSRREERRPSSRKSSHPPPEQVQQQQKSEQQRATTILGQCLRRFSAWIQSSLGVDSRENSSNVAVRDPHVTMPSFMHNSHSFSSMSSISSSTQPPPMASKHGSLLPPGCQKMQQQQIPTLTITRDSLGHNAPQIAGMLSAETKTVEKDAVYLSSRNDECRRSSGFLQTLFAPISSFQRRRKKTKAERRAHKAFRTITFIVGLFAILWSPYYVVATVYGFCRGDCIPAFLYNLSYYMCYLNSSLNPFAYALANRQFRSAFSRILRGNFRQSH